MPDRGAPTGTRTVLSGAPTRYRLGVRVLATLALLALVGTFVAAQIDLVRRHVPGIEPERYWLPQLRQIWAPGLAGAALLAALAFALQRLPGRK